MATKITFNDELSHYGVKGMRWGVRNSRPEGVSRSTNRAAKKDAKEFTRAKMYYGEGAGTKVYNKVRKTSIDDIRSAARMAAERQRHKDFYDQFRAAGIKI